MPHEFGNYSDTMPLTGHGNDLSILVLLYFDFIVGKGMLPVNYFCFNNCSFCEDHKAVTTLS